MTALDTLQGTTLGSSNFSVFIVPFRYGLAVAAPAGAEASYRQEDIDWDDPRVRQRANYVIGETRELVFGRGKDSSPQFEELSPELARYRLEPSLRLRWYTDKATPFDLDAWAHIVLFDASAAANPKLKKHQRGGHIGFLLLHVAASEAMTFADLLDLNENLRLVRYQHDLQRPALDRRNSKSPENGIRRFPGFEMGPERAVREGEADPWQVGLWEALLRHPLIQQDGKVCRLVDPDLTVNPDERAFVASHACVSGLAWETERSSRLWTLWHQFLHVESGETPRRGFLTSYEDEWARQRTYFRWGGDASDARLYGFSNYSFNSLCSPRARALPAQHFLDMYLDQLLLVFYQRVAVFSFSRTLAALSQRWKKEGWGDVRSAFAELRESFDQFVNLYWFPAFSNQVQSLEMYEIARRELDNKVLFEELREEMEGTWGHMESRNADMLNRGGAVVAAFGLTLTYLGISLFKTFPDKNVAELVFPSLDALLILLVLTSAFMAAIEWRAIRRRRHCGAWVVIALILSAAMFYANWSAIVVWIKSILAIVNALGDRVWH